MPDLITCSISPQGYDKTAVIPMYLDGSSHDQAKVLIFQSGSVLGPYSPQQVQGNRSCGILSVRTVDIFTIFVLNGADNRTYTFENVRSTEKIKDLRARIFHRLQEPESQMRLDFHGRPLRDEETVAEAGIGNESTLQIIPGRLRGGI